MNIIVDTGCANLSSVRFAVERLGYDVAISAEPDLILNADKVFLPGVGTVAAAMQQLHEKQLVEVVQSVTAPLLGICLGMQILVESSFEGGASVAETAQDCLGLIPGTITKLEPKQNLPLPHMGWNQVKPNNHPLFANIDPQSFFYFVHSYALGVSDVTIAECDYGASFSAAIGKDNFMGVQFHPERSGKAGAQLLKNFLEM
ncbi:imidazole glycerol phosphate synthase subunit HisH [Celerinatantimonas diazotrophica]|uniref:Imidazole glycerol phosphate synthase subunit HisH n=1 Tax=Celerinatantimonas diazotrophica TaxID=412034 RepID=A0A4R1JAS6_9GAMM|nr:imidazole glycerol phosphate synthase subunit HisH [Celerinatantimonas diazotrophica]TCK47607.1 imidazole glycerol phosphate synthase subunit HisH [Celerinatantimonas diazotrophica]CAG9296770.1 Imidazole glycerol phosphate synthase subunit HisH [Celerinatantimonas diazotrophica]